MDTTIEKIVQAQYKHITEKFGIPAAEQTEYQYTASADSVISRITAKQFITSWLEGDEVKHNIYSS